MKISHGIFRNCPPILWASRVVTTTCLNLGHLYLTYLTRVWTVDCWSGLQLFSCVFVQHVGIDKLWLCTLWSLVDILAIVVILTIYIYYNWCSRSPSSSDAFCFLDVELQWCKVQSDLKSRWTHTIFVDCLQSGCDFSSFNRLTIFWCILQKSHEIRSGMNTVNFTHAHHPTLDALGQLPDAKAGCREGGVKI